MATVKELREQQARIATNARAKFDEIKDDTLQGRAAEIEREFDAMMAEHDALGSRAERMEKLEAAERFAAGGRDSRRPAGTDAAADAGNGASGGEPTYREAFAAHLRALAEPGYYIEPEMRAVLRRGAVQLPKDAERRAQTTADSAGGYTIPQQLADVLVRSMLAWGPMYDPGVTTELITAGGGVITMPTVNDTAVAAEPHTEGATLTDDGGKDVTFGEKALEAYAFNTEWVRISRELLDDSLFNMEAVVGSLLGERLGRIANLRLTTGTGSSQPHGIVTASSLGKTATGTTAITWDEVLDLEHSVDPAYRSAPTSRYMFNDSTLLALRKLKDGDGNYLWQLGDVQRGLPASFNGRAYSINQAMASLGAAAKVMLFGDFSKYFVRKVGAPLVAAIGDKDFWPGVGMAGYIRFDGELSDTAAVKHLITAAS